MAVNINASTSSGVGITSDNSGVIQFQSNGANTVQIAANAALLTTGGGTLVPPATGVVTIPAGTGTVAVANVSSAIVLRTAQNSTSGTAIDFTGIPSWVKRITINLNGVSTNGTSIVLVQIGDGSIQTSGYLGAVTLFNSGGAGTSQSGGTGFDLERVSHTAASVLYGQVVLTLVDSTSNTWIFTSNIAYSSSAIAYVAAGGKDLTNALDRIRITTANGTDSFDAGSINIMYE